MTVKINFNGDIGEDACISAFDHGFLFGDSVYEVVGTIGNKPCLLDKHLQRLKLSAEGIGLKVPCSDEKFIREIERTLQAAGNSESYIRIIITRGVGEIDIDPDSCENPNVLVYVTNARNYPIEDYKKGINVALVSIKRNTAEALNPGIKTGNYLNNVLAKIEAAKLGAKEALMLNAGGQLAECTTSNFFMVQGGKIMTPSLECGILSGITREMVIQLARENGILVEEGKWPAEVLEKGEEFFLTGTLARVLPVTKLNGKVIQNGKPGPVTKKLIRLFDARLKELV